MKIRHLALLPALALAQAVFAAEQLDTVVVSASRMPEASVDTAASIQVIDRKTIEQSGANNLVDVLRGRAGVHIVDLFGDGSNATIDMRGFGSSAGSNVLVMLDGRRLNPATDASTLYLGDIPLDQVERIEVIHGSSGVLFGNQAVGGVINIITRGTGKRDSYSVSAGLGSYQRHSLGFNAQHHNDKGFGIRVNARHSETDNYRDHNAAETQNLNVLADYRHDDGRVFIEQRYLHEELLTPGALFLDELAADRQQSVATYATDYLDTRSTVTRGGIEHWLNDNWRVDAELAWRDDRREFMQNSRTFVSPLSLQTRRVLTFTPRAHGSFATDNGEARLTVGADYEHTDYQIDALILQRAEQQIVAAYAQLIYPLSRGLDASIGLRHARVNNDIAHDIGGFADSALNLDDDVTVGSLGLTWRPDAHWRWFARADQNYRFAKLEEHTLDLASNAFPFLPQGIDNQRGISFETGFEYQHAQGSLSVQLYRLQLDDEITFDAANFANINLEQTTRHGLNLAWEQQLNTQLTVNLDLELTAGKVTAGPYDGRRIPMVPKYQLRTSAYWQVDPQLLLGAEGVHVGEQVLDSDYDNSFRRLDAYTVVNLNARYKIAQWTLSARVNNLFDTRYSEYGVVGQDSPGSGHPECVAGLFSDSCPAFNPAPERNVWIGAEYRFED